MDRARKDMLEACRDGCVDTVRRLITDCIVDVNVNLRLCDKYMYVTRTCTCILKNVPKNMDDSLYTSSSRTEIIDGSTPLYVACAAGSTEVVRYLLSIPECQVNRINAFYRRTPLHEVCSHKDVLTPIISLLLARKDCDPNVKDHCGNTPLFVAIDNHHSKIVQLLLSNPKCDPNVRNVVGDNPLHLATRTNDAEIIQLLLANPQCDLDVRNNQGDTPLYVACKKMNAKTPLESGKCDPNVRMEPGDTPLHQIYTTLVDSTIKLLLAEPECDPDGRNNQGDTPLDVACEKMAKTPLESGTCDPNVRMKPGDTPLRLTATQMVDKLTQLVLADPQCDPNGQNNQGDTLLYANFAYKGLRAKYALFRVQTKTGDTPLQISTETKDAEIIQLLLANPRCDPNVANDQGETPLHVVCTRNKEIVKTLLESGKCAPNIRTNAGDTPLHLATQVMNIPIIRLLLNNPHCRPNMSDSKGNTALHIIVAKEDICRLKCFLSSSNRINLNYQNAKGETALHVVVTLNNPATVKLLVSDPDCNPNVRDHDGNTPLTIACQLDRVDIVTLLLSSGRVDPECVNNAGETPAELATDYCIINKISSFIAAIHKHPVETFVKIFIVGNAETGKSTLTQAICTEAYRLPWFVKPMAWLIPAHYRQVKPEDVDPHTAGIIPRRFRSQHFGNTVLYDFAGQHEYYSSHAAVMENVAVPTPPAFIVVVDISEPIDQITGKLTYWWSFIENHCKRTSAPPPVILVGSHQDVVIKARKENVEEKMKQILQSLALEDLPTTFHFVGNVTLDCRDLISKELDKLLLLLSEACMSLRKSSDVDLRCHVLCAFLSNKFQSSIACKVSEVISTIKKEKENTLLPQNPTELEHLLSTLSDKGQVLVLKNTSNPKDSWILLQREKLLSEVNGSIFAPDNFRQSIKDFARSTGVVPHSKIQKQFQQYPLDIVIGFLSHLEFCFKIHDYRTLGMIAGEWEPQSHTLPTHKDEKFYFFPALVRVEYPTDVWKQDQPPMETPKPATTFQCGWFYQCSLPNHFLTSRFLHVLILRLAFKFALAVDRNPSERSPVIRRRCSVWKHGIAWWDRNGIETVVEVDLQCRWVTVMMRSSAGQEVECTHRRTAIMKNILNTKEEFCPAVAMTQSMIHPDCLQYPLEQRLREGIIQYSLKEVAGAVVEGTQCAVDEDGTNPIALVKLLPFEPFYALGQTAIAKLFCTKTVTRDVHVTDTDLTEVAERAYEMFREANPSHDHHRRNPNNPIVCCKNLLKRVRDRGRGSFRELEQALSQFSIFCGENPLVSTSIQCLGHFTFSLSHSLSLSLSSPAALGPEE